MTSIERVAYIRGLAEGLELDDSKKEVKIIKAIIELLDDMALSVSDLEEGLSDVANQLDEVDEDLGALEARSFGVTDECAGDDDDDDCYYEVTCPNCNETICLSEDVVCDGQIDCPNCGEPLEFDLDDCDCDDCDCCGQH